MIKHLWSIFCKKSLVDSTNNNISLLEEIEELDININVPSNFEDIAINIPLDSELVSLWYREQSKENTSFDTKFTLISPTDVELNSLENKIIFPEGKKRLRTIIKINGLGLTHSGTYLLRLSKKESKENNFTTVVELPIDIKLKKSVSMEIPLRKENSLLK